MGNFQEDDTGWGPPHRIHDLLLLRRVAPLLLWRLLVLLPPSPRAGGKRCAREREGTEQARRIRGIFV